MFRRIAFPGLMGLAFLTACLCMPALAGKGDKAKDRDRDKEKETSKKYVDIIIDLDRVILYSGPRPKEKARDKEKPGFLSLLFGLGKEDEDKNKAVEPEDTSGNRYAKDRDLIVAQGRKWKIAPGAPEFLLSLEQSVKEIEKKTGRKPRISFVSARTDARERNIEATKQIQLADGRTAYDLAQGRVFSREDMPREDGERRVKDLSSKLNGFDPNYLALFDDNVKYIARDQIGNLIWIHYGDRNRKLAIAAGVFEKAIRQVDDRHSLKEAIDDTLYEEKGKGNKKEKTLVNAEADRHFLERGLSAFRRVNPKYTPPSGKDLENENELVKDPSATFEAEKREFLTPKPKKYIFDDDDDDDHKSRNRSHKGDSEDKSSPVSSRREEDRRETDRKEQRDPKRLLSESEYKDLKTIALRLIALYPPKENFFVVRGGELNGLTELLKCLLPGGVRPLPLAAYDYSVFSRADGAAHNKLFRILDVFFPSEKMLGGKNVVLIDFNHGPRTPLLFHDIAQYLSPRHRKLEVAVLDPLGASSISGKGYSGRSVDILPQRAFRSHMKEMGASYALMPDLNPYFDSKLPDNKEEYQNFRKALQRRIRKDPDFSSDARRAMADSLSEFPDSCANDFDKLTRGAH